MFGGDTKVEKAIYTLAFTILISAIIFSGSLVFSASLLAGGGVNIGSNTATGNAAALPTGQQAAAPPAQPTQNPTPSPAVNVATGNLPAKGDSNAPVTVVEFSDFQCPFCGRFYTNTLDQLVSEYVDTGKVKFYYRHFPLSFHPNAQPAAEASECANEQGKFWEFHDKIFQNQDSMGESAYKQWAADLGLDTGQFNSCLDSGKYRSAVQADFAAGSQAGVSGTPTFFVNGKKLVGAQPFSAFKSLIDSELAAG